MERKLQIFVFSYRHSTKTKKPFDRFKGLFCLLKCMSGISNLFLDEPCIDDLIGIGSDNNKIGSRFQVVNHHRIVGFVILCF